MADSKLHDLTGLVTLAALDEIYVVDVSDTTDSADGSSKKYAVGITSGFVGLTDTQTLTNKTLTSPTITGGTLTSPVINTGISGTAIVDEDTMVSDSATKVPTQQSVKAYVDTHMADTTTHGTTGAIVGISDTQTLTNKTLTTPVINGAVTGTMTPPLTFYGANFYAPEGFLLNGKIVPSVASNNLTVALKGLDGNDPSATNPIYVRIGDTVHSITSALSVTKNAGTNWFNAGSSELATKEIDYFVYLGYNATDGVVIGFSRIPYATQYDQFSATTTNEKYCAISTISNAAAGDDYTVIGRFAATLSAGTAGYTWTVPTFTTINLIQRPIFNTRLLTWNPAFGASGSMTFTTVTDTSEYVVSNYDVLYRIYFAGTTGGTASTDITMTLPFSVYNNYQGGGGYALDGFWLMGNWFISENNVLRLRRYGLDNWSLDTNRTWLGNVSTSLL